MPALLMMTATGEPRQVQLNPQSNRVGRGPTNDVIIDASVASRNHAVIDVEQAQPALLAEGEADHAAELDELRLAEVAVQPLP